MKTADQNIRITESKTRRNLWLWQVLTDEGEIFAQGEDELSYDWAVWSALGSLSEYRKLADSPITEIEIDVQSAKENLKETMQNKRAIVEGELRN